MLKVKGKQNYMRFKPYGFICLTEFKGFKGVSPRLAYTEKGTLDQIIIEFNGDVCIYGSGHKDVDPRIMDKLYDLIIDGLVEKV